jgi:hypothetical protein
MWLKVVKVLVPGWLLASVDCVHHVTNLQDTQEQDLKVLVGPKSIAAFD